MSRSLIALDQNSTIIAVIEMSQSSCLVAGMLPGIERQPCKKLEPSPERLLAVLHRWRDEAVRAGRTITRIALAFEAGRDGFWLARWLRAHGVEAHVIHPTSVAVSRERDGRMVPAGGAELSYVPLEGWLFALRAGARRVEGGPTPHRQPYTFGATAALDRFALDYAFEAIKGGHAAHRIGIRIQ